MGIKLPPKQLALYKRIDEILWRDWDPIGISRFPEARDEYYAYLPQTFKLVMDGAGPKAIAGYLLSVERDCMGFRGDSRNCHNVAKTIVRKKKSLGL